jgi:hypothetical protein
MWIFINETLNTFVEEVSTNKVEVIVMIGAWGEILLWADELDKIFLMIP